MKKQIWLSVALLLMLVLGAGCDKKDPFVDPGNTADPQWTVTVENDMTASMTAVVRVQIGEGEGTLAAFMGEACCDVAEYIDGLYWLYLSPASEEGGDVQLKFYSPTLKRIFVTTETFLYRNDTQLGTVAEPYTPQWKALD